ncbi:uncharacterized protein V1518DRAFT_408868 [Limtongia smithiae]|uniref:uncharacterized protein n=1 Tax=Limtongia smithiae TaxID=1125753 RepID=UPI0034CEE0A1
MSNNLKVCNDLERVPLDWSTTERTSSQVVTMSLNSPESPSKAVFLDGDASQAAEFPKFAIPGQPLCSARDYIAGPGTYVDDKVSLIPGSLVGSVVATLLGEVVVTWPAEGGERASPTIAEGNDTVMTNGIASGNGSDKRSTSRGLQRPSSASPSREGGPRFGSPARDDSLLSGRRPQVSVVRAATTGSTVATNAVPDVGDTVLVRVLRTTPRNAVVAIVVVGDGKPTEEYGGVIRAQDVRETEKDRVRIEASFRPGDLVRAQVLSLGDGTNYYLTTARNDLGVVFAISEAAGAPMYPIDWRTMKCPVSGTTEERKCAKPTT